MRKFIVQTRPLSGYPKTDAPLIVEVEGELVFPLEDPSVQWLPQDEYKFRITKPEALYEPKEAPHIKEKTMVPSVYHSHSVFSSIEEAKEKAEILVSLSFEFAYRKQKVEYTATEVIDKRNLIKAIMLP